MGRYKFIYEDEHGVEQVKVEADSGGNIDEIRSVIFGFLVASSWHPSQVSAILNIEEE